MGAGLVNPGYYPLPWTPGHGPGVGHPGGLPAPLNPGPWARGWSTRGTTRSREPRAMGPGSVTPGDYPLPW